MSHQSPPHPFFSRLGCGAALLLMLALALITWFSGGILFSPGALSAAQTPGQALEGYASHADFEHECGQCHQSWRGVTAGRCERCHTNVAQQRLSGTGMHARFENAGDCAVCHSEHLGRHANISEKAIDQVDHETSFAFSLVKHAKTYDGAVLACGDCHRDLDFGRDQIDCQTCHADHDAAFMQEHVALFGADCLACHDGLDTMAAFDHAQVFPLAGAHADVDCAGCHEDRVFAGTPRECAGCHAEPELHAGRFGLDCSRCHSESGWSPAAITRHVFPFDHGGEGKIACETCHQETYTIYTCYDCHAHSPADIKASHIEEGIRDFENCIECHPTGLKEEGEGGERD